MNQSIKQLAHYLPLMVLLLLGTASELLAQNFTVSGYMRAADTGEELLYANVYVPGSETGVTTNLYGFYSITLPQGKYTLEYSYIGYQKESIDIDLSQNIEQNIELKSLSQELDVVIVTGEREDVNVTSTEMSAVKLDMKEAKFIPVLLGEQDVIKTMQLMPGVSASSEGGSGFFVRGGDADQNLILLDEAPVYNASHLLGFFSVFNSDALKDVKLYKGGIPAEYGGRASSVMDIRMKNGNSKKWGATGGIGLISSRLTLEGPLVKDKGSIMISGRRTYADLLLKAVTSQFDNTSLYFYDLNLKANYQITKNDRIYLSGYFGRDVFGIENAGIDWGNTTGTLRWNHTFSSKLFSNTSFIYSDFDYGFGVESDGLDIELSAGIFDYNLKQDYNWYLNPKNTIKFGWQGIYHRFKPTTFLLDGESAGVDTELQEQYALEGGVYVANEQKVNKKISLNYGLRLSGIGNIGSYTEKEYNAEDEIISSTTHGKGEFYNSFLGLEPRVNATYLLNDASSIKASYNRIYQYLHLLSNSNSGTPTDLWIPSSKLVKPQIADQVAFGYFRNFKDNMYEFSVEGYYKNLQNQVDYEDGAEAFLNPDIEAELVFGKGRAYGAEFFLRKNKGKLTGWISYTLSKSERQFDEISGGKWFSARQDRTHDVSVVATYQITPRVNIAGSWVFYNGDAVTFPSGKYYVDGALVNLYTDRNSSRMPNYHRMDIGITAVLKDNAKRYSDINLSAYNLYNRKNAYTIDFSENAETGETEATRTALFGIVPSITWNFRF